MKTIKQFTLVLVATIGICVCVNAENTLSPEQIWKEGVKWTEVLIGIKYEPYRQEAYKTSYELRDTSDIRGEKFLNLYRNGRLTNINIRQHEGKLQFAIHILPQAGMEDSTYVFDRYDFNTWELGQYAVERALELQQPFSGILNVFDLIKNRLKYEYWLPCPDYPDKGLYMYSYLPESEFNPLKSNIDILNVGFTNTQGYGFVDCLTSPAPNGNDYLYQSQYYITEFYDSKGKVIFRHPGYEDIMAIYRGDVGGLDDINANDTECTVYTLDGRMVLTNPDDGWEHTVTPGIYLLRQSGKTRKILVR